MDDFEQKYQSYLHEIEQALPSYIDDFSSKNQSLKSSMSYSLLSGGKRIRPVILLAMADFFGLSVKQAMPYAIALEMIHTHSLIHDDLPALDNDDYRRGRASNHKVYGEAMAILGGDALLNHAYSILFEQSEKGPNEAKAAKYMCDCTGDDGMLAGQANDIEAEGTKDLSEQHLLAVYENKTGKLLECPFCVPSLLRGGDRFEECKKLGDLVGYLFQLTDDILDVEGTFASMGKTLGKDQTEGKLTAITVYGYDGSKQRVEAAEKEAKRLIQTLGLPSAFFVGLIDFIATRKN